MLPPVMIRPHFLPRKRSGIGQQGGQGGRAGALGHGLLDIAVEGDGPLEEGLLDQQHVVDQRPGDGVGEVADLLDRDALGDGRAAAGAPALTPRMRAVNEGYMAGSTPTTRMSGFTCLAAVATPEIRPPPPIGTGRTSRSGTSSSISSATVPWPAITS